MEAVGGSAEEEDSGRQENGVTRFRENQGRWGTRVRIRAQPSGPVTGMLTCLAARRSLQLKPLSFSQLGIIVKCGLQLRSDSELIWSRLTESITASVSVLSSAAAERVEQSRTEGNRNTLTVRSHFPFLYIHENIVDNRNLQHLPASDWHTHTWTRWSEAGGVGKVGNEAGQRPVRTSGPESCWHHAPPPTVCGSDFVMFSIIGDTRSSPGLIFLSLFPSLSRINTPEVCECFIHLHLVFAELWESRLHNEAERLGRCFCVLCREIWVIFPPWRPDWIRPWGLLCCGLSLFKASLCTQLRGMPITLWSHVPLRAARLLQSCCSQVPVSQHMAAARAGGKVQRDLVVFLGITEGNMMILSCVGLGSCRASTVADADAVFFCFSEWRKAMHLFLMCSGLNIQRPCLQLDSFTLSSWLKQCVRNVKM